MSKDYNKCYHRARSMINSSCMPYNSMAGVFGHIKRRFAIETQRLSNGTDYLELPKIVAVSKSLWKK